MNSEDIILHRREIDRKYREANKEKLKLYRHNYYILNKSKKKESRLAQNREKYKKNRTKILQAQVARYKINREKIRKRRNEQYKKRRERLKNEQYKELLIDNIILKMLDTLPVSPFDIEN